MSDMVNRTRARDAARSIAATLLNAGKDGKTAVAAAPMRFLPPGAVTVPGAGESALEPVGGLS